LVKIFWKDVGSNVFSTQMLVQLFQKSVGVTLSKKMLVRNFMKNSWFNILFEKYCNIFKKCWNIFRLIIMRWDG
jgi:hypothetical protein